MITGTENVQAVGLVSESPCLIPPCRRGQNFPSSDVHDCRGHQEPGPPWSATRLRKRQSYFPSLWEVISTLLHGKISNDMSDLLCWFQENLCIKLLLCVVCAIEEGEYPLDQMTAWEMRRAILMCTKKLKLVSLIYLIEPKTEQSKKQTKTKTGIGQSYIGFRF